MKTTALFCLSFAALMFGCAHRPPPDTNEPEPLFMEEEGDEGYSMLEDEDVGISSGDQDKSAQAQTSAISNP